VCQILTNGKGLTSSQSSVSIAVGNVNSGTAGQAAVYPANGTSVQGGTLSIGGGGTNATTAAGALTNLGALPLAGGTMTGTLIAPVVLLGSSVTPAVGTRLQIGDNFAAADGAVIKNFNSAGAETISFFNDQTSNSSGNYLNSAAFGITGSTWVTSSGYFAPANTAFYAANGISLVFGTTGPQSNYGYYNNSVAFGQDSTGFLVKSAAASSGHFCLQVDTNGYLTNTGAACGSGSYLPIAGGTVTGAIAYSTPAVAQTSASNIINGGGAGFPPVPGLVGNGSTDDSTAITSALTTGGSFILPTVLQGNAGVIALQNTVYFSQSGAQLYGQGWGKYTKGTTTLNYSPSTGSAIRIDGQLTPSNWITNTPYTMVWAGTIANMNILAPNTASGAGILMTDISGNSGNYSLRDMYIRAQHGIYAISYDGSRISNVFTDGGTSLLSQQPVNMFQGRTANSLNIDGLRGSCSGLSYFAQILFGFGNKVRITETGGCGGILYVGGWGTTGTTAPTITPVYASVSGSTGGYTMTSISVSGGSNDWVQPITASFSTSVCPIAPTLEPIVNAPYGYPGQITQIQIVDGGYCTSNTPTITLAAPQSSASVNDFDIGDTENLQGPIVYVARNSIAKGTWSGGQGSNLYLSAPAQVDTVAKLTVLSPPTINHQMLLPTVTDGGTGGSGAYSSGGTFYFFLQAVSSISCNPTVAASTYVPACTNGVSPGASITLTANHQALVTFPTPYMAASGTATVTYNIYRGTTSTASAAVLIASVTLPAASYLSPGNETTGGNPATNNIPMIALLSTYSGATVTGAIEGVSSTGLSYGDTIIDAYGNYYNAYTNEPVFHSLPSASPLYRAKGVWVLCSGGTTCTDGYYKSICYSTGGAQTCTWSNNLATVIGAPTLTTTGTSGAATLSCTGTPPSCALNVPNYGAAAATPSFGSGGFVDVQAGNVTGSFTAFGDSVTNCTGETANAISLAASGYPLRVSQTSAATSSDCAGWTGLNSAYTGNQPYVQFGFDFPSASDYNTTSRSWIGLSSCPTTMGSSDMASTTTCNFAAIRYSTSASDTVYQCVTGNGSSTTVTPITSATPSTAFTWAAINIGASSVTCTVGGTGYPLSGGYSATNTTTLPSPATLGVVLSNTTLANTAIHFAAKGWKGYDQNSSY
jgi:hypothetical protein